MAFLQDVDDVQKMEIEKGQCFLLCQFCEYYNLL